MRCLGVDTTARPAQGSVSPGVAGLDGQRARDVGQAGAGIVAEPRQPQQGGHVVGIENQGSAELAPRCGPLPSVSCALAFVKQVYNTASPLPWMFPWPPATATHRPR